MFRNIIVAVLALIFSLVSALSFSGNGSGTEEDPYQITTVEQLQEMNDELDAHYILMNDIDASETREWNVGDHDNDPATPDSAMGFEPVGTYEEDNPNAGFTGTFDGQGFTIFNLFINRPLESNLGLFGCITNNSKIHDAIINEAVITGKAETGALVGRVFSDKKVTPITIEDCSVKGKIVGAYNIGGMLGDILTFYGSVLINNCTSAVDIHRSYRYDNNPWSYGIGGLIGSCVSWGDTIIIKKSHSTGSIFSSSNNALVNVGGFCGKTSSITKSMVKIFDCYSSGNIFSENNDQWNIGGFCGENGARSWDHSSAIIENCYSSGDIILVNEEERNTTEVVGGFCGKNISYGECVAIINNCYSTGNIFVKNEYVKKIGGFCGWNSLEPDGGVDLLLIENCHSTGSITCEGKEVSLVGGFCGSASIDFIYEKDYAFIKNCYSTGNVSGGIDNAGGFLGFNSININSCYSTGNVKGDNTVGGFCGFNYKKISNSYSTGNVVGYKNIGGFCGLSFRDYDNHITTVIENCYSTGKAIGDTLVGGFCAIQSGDGNKEIISCYWDTQTSGITESDGGIGKTTAEMMMQSTFIDWDFDDIWCIVEGESYPQLQHFVDCDTLVSVPQKELNSELLLYPNPASITLNISIKSIATYNANIEIYNQLGQVVFSDPSVDITQPYKVNTSIFPPGIYYLKVSASGISEVRSFVVYR